MKTCKKLLAVLLSLMMIASVIVVPATAEEAAAENYVSLLDMSGLTAGTTTEDDAAALPEGLTEIGISRWTPGGCGLGAMYSGKQEIVELEDGSMGWKINYNKAATHNGHLWGSSGLLGFKVTIPESMVPYVNGIKLNVDNATTGGLRYRFGVSDGSKYATTNSNGPLALATGTSAVTEFTTTQLRAYNSIFAATNTVALSETTWVDSGYDSKEIYVIMSDSAAAEGGTGYTVIKDIGVTLSIPVEDIPVEKDYSIFDLTDAAVGTTTTGDSAVVPAGVAGVSRWAFGQGCTYHTGTQEIVEVNGKKALKVYFDVAGKQNGWIYGSKGVYAVKITVPAKYAPYVSAIHADVTAATVGSTAYRFGVTNGSAIGIVNDAGVDSATNNATTTITKKVSDMQLASGTYAAFHDGASGKWSDSGNEITDLFFLVTDQGAVDGGTGYIIINDISVTVNASPSVHENMPIEKDFSIFDLSNTPLGTMTDYPDGMGAFKHTATDAVQKVVETESGEKALEIDLVSGGFSGGSTRLTAQDGRQGYTPWYGLGIDIPAGYVPYVTGITFKVTKNTDAIICYNFGVTDGSSFSKIGTGENATISAATTGEKTITYTMNDINKIGDWYFSRYGGGTDKWAADFNKAYLVFGASEATGTFVINDVILHTSASQTQYDNMPVTQTVSLWDLSKNEIGTTENIKYGRGTMVSGYTGALEVVEGKNGKNALRFDFDNTTFNKVHDRINEGGLSPVYEVKLSILPPQYAPYIDNIKIKFNKQTESRVPYNFGVWADGTYSKLREGANSVMDADTLGTTVIDLNPDSLYKCDSWGAGAYSDPTGGAKWAGDFTALFLRMSGNAGATGYIDIEDVTYTITMSAAEKAAADAEYAEYKAFITGFEGSGTETPFATSGAKAYYYASNSSYNQSTGVAINSNVWYDTAKGFSFWIYNDAEATASLRMNYSILGVAHAETFSVPAKSRKKIVIDYSKAHKRTSGDNWWGSTTASDFTAEEIAANITSVSFVETGRNNKPLYFDDFYLIFDEMINEKPGSDIEITADNVTGGTVTEDGKIEIPVAAEDQVVAIKIPKGTLTEASYLTYKLSSTATANTSLKFYLGTTKDLTGKAAYIKKGENPWSFSIAAGATDYTNTMDFYAGGGGSVCVRVFEGAWYLNNWMPNSSLHPSASEKANIDTIYLAVKGYGELAEGAEVPTGSIFIEGFDFVNVGVKVKATTVENGSVSVIDEKVFIGETAEFVVTPATGYFLKSMTVVDSLGNELAYTHNKQNGAENLGLFYAVTAPAADVIITPEFAPIEVTIPFEARYEEENLVIDYVVPFTNGKVFNTATTAEETITGYGIIIAADEALDKYGYTVDDLTPEFAAEMIASGHHIANYLYMVDDANIVKTEENADIIRFTVEITDVTLRARRAPFAMAAFATFVDAEGAESAAAIEPNYNTMDMTVYGDNLSEEFYAENGINYQASLTADLSVWEDIKDQGFDHIRLPITMGGRMDENYQIIDEEMADVDYAIDNALRAGFSIVIDTHSLGVDISGDYANSVDAYYTVWEQLAERYKNLPLSVAFQFVNEPMTNRKTETAEDGTVTNPDPLTDDELMEFQYKLVTDCRAVVGNELRTMVISNHNNGSWALGQFTDEIMSLENVIIDIHYYHPMAFTHSGSEGWDNIPGNGYESGANVYSQADIVSFATKCANFAAANGVTVWVGEWGAYQPDYTAKVAYYADFAKAASDAGIPWALWEYGSGFSPYKNGAWDQEILDAIFEFDGVNDTPAEA